MSSLDHITTGVKRVALYSRLEDSFTVVRAEYAMATVRVMSRSCDVTAVCGTLRPVRRQALSPPNVGESGALIQDAG